MRPVVWSHSSLNTYLDCHLAWYFAYVTLEEEEYDEARAIGIEVHEYAEALLRAGGPVLKGGPCGICEMVPHSPQCPNSIGTSAPLVDIFIDQILPTYRDPVLIEAGFQYELDGIPVSGVIDALDVHAFTEGSPPDVDVAVPGEAHILRDLKTAKQRPRKGRYRLQTTLYWLGAEELGYPPDAAQLDYIVRTKVPYYWPEVVEPITEDDVDVLSATLQAVQDGVSRRDYDPTGLGTVACASCGYRPICGPYQRFQEASNPIRREARMSPADLGLTSSLEKPR